MASWTPKVDHVDKILAAHINALQTLKADADGGAVVTFSFDDGHESLYTTGKAVFDNHNIGATAFIITDLIGDSGKLTEAMLSDLFNLGWEIASHSASHVDLTTVGDAEIVAELSVSRSVLAGLGYPCRTFAYPYGGHNATVRSFVKQYYEMARAASGGVQSFPITTFQLKAVGLDGLSLDDAKAYIDSVVETGGMLNFFGHAIDTTMATYLNNLITYIESKGIQILTMENALAVIGNLADHAHPAYGEAGEAGEVSTLVKMFSEGWAWGAFIDGIGYRNWNSLLSLSGSTVLYSTESTGNWYRISTEATLDTSSRLTGQYSETVLPQNPTWVCRFKTYSGLTNMRIFVGLASALKTTNNDTAPTEFIGIRYSSVVGANWYVCARDGTTQSNTDSGVVVVASTVYTLKIVIMGGNSAVVYLNGVLLGTFNTNLPQAATTLGPYLQIFTNENAKKYSSFGNWYGECRWQS